MGNDAFSSVTSVSLTSIYDFQLITLDVPFTNGSYTPGYNAFISLAPTRIVADESKDDNND